MTQINEARERLLPCPFCGDDGEKEVNGLVHGGETANDWVRCLVCNSTARQANWNRRIEDAKLREAETRHLNLLLDVRRLTEGGERTGLFEDVEAIARLLARAAAPAVVSEESEREKPSVPDHVLTYVHAYGDARADDDGTSPDRLGEAIRAMRQWGADLARATRAPQAGEEVEFEVRLLGYDGESEYPVASASGPNALGEAMNYARQYLDEGPTRVFKVVRTEVAALSLGATQEAD